MQFDLHPGKTKTGLAKALGLEPPAISKILNGTRQIKAKEYATMRLYFGMPVDGHKSASPSHPSSTQDNFHYHDSGVGTYEHRHSPAGSDSINNVHVITITDKMMEPVFLMHEQVLIDCSDRPQETDDYYAISDGINFMVRLCAICKDNPSYIRISAIKSRFETQTRLEKEIHVLGRVTAKLTPIERP